MGRMISGIIAFVCETPVCTKCGGHDYYEEVMSIGYTTLDDPIGHNRITEWRCVNCETTLHRRDTSGTPG